MDTKVSCRRTALNRCNAFSSPDTLLIYNFRYDYYFILVDKNMHSAPETASHFTKIPHCAFWRLEVVLWSRHRLYVRNYYDSRPARYNATSVKRFLPNLRICKKVFNYACWKIVNERSVITYAKEK